MGCSSEIFRQMVLNWKLPSASLAPLMRQMSYCSAKLDVLEFWSGRFRKFVLSKELVLVFKSIHVVVYFKGANTALHAAIIGADKDTARMKAVKDGFLALDTALVCPLTIPLIALELECLDWIFELVKHKSFLDEVVGFVGLSSSGAGSIRVEACSITWKMAGIQRRLLEAKKWTRGLEEAARALQEVSMMPYTDKDG
jgi:hypothetical protein